MIVRTRPPSRKSLRHKEREHVVKLQPGGGRIGVRREMSSQMDWDYVLLVSQGRNRGTGSPPRAVLRRQGVIVYLRMKPKLLYRGSVNAVVLYYSILRNEP